MDFDIVFRMTDSSLCHSFQFTFHIWNFDLWARMETLGVKMETK